MKEHRIQLQPSGHTFHAVEQENLLDAALRSGLNVSYGCSRGSCGDCRARLIEGELGPHDFHDFHFSDAEKVEGQFLLCTAHAASDLVIETDEASSAHDIPHQQLTARVSKVDEVSERLRILQLRTPRTRPLRFLAGQHVALTLPGVGTLDSNIASCPCNGSQLQFHVPFEPDNPFVETLFAGLRHGTEIEVEGPFGEMTLDDDSSRPLLMVAEGYELPPLKSLIEHAVNLDVAQQVRLIWLAREGEHYQENHCRSWGEALDDYAYLPITYAEDEAPALRLERVFRVIAEEADNIGEWDIYWAGSCDFNEALQERLLSAGADAQRLFYSRRRQCRRGALQAVGA